MVAASSAPNPIVTGASWLINTRPVFAADYQYNKKKKDKIVKIISVTQIRFLIIHNMDQVSLEKAF